MSAISARLCSTGFYVRRHGGQFVLRLDDTDRQRSKPEFEAAIERDLTWLGLSWDRKERQSDRLAEYDVARDRLVGAGRLYPCYETQEELDFKRKRLLSQGKPPVYDRAALRLDAAGRQKLEAEGRRPHWRFKLVAEEKCAGTIWCAGPSMSTRRARAIPCWCAPTAPISTVSPRWWTTSPWRSRT